MFAGSASESSAQAVLTDLLGLNQLVLGPGDITATVGGAPVDIATLLGTFGTPVGAPAAPAAPVTCIPAVGAAGFAPFGFGIGGINIVVINIFAGPAFGGFGGLGPLGGGFVNTGTIDIDITINITINAAGGSPTAPMMMAGMGGMGGLVD